MHIDHVCFPIRSTARALCFAVVSVVAAMGGSRAHGQPGTVLSHQKISSTAGGFTGILDNSDRFGSSLASLGDLDGDGVTDLAVGAWTDDDGGFDRGAVWVLFLDGVAVCTTPGFAAGLHGVSAGVCRAG